MAARRKTVHNDDPFNTVFGIIVVVVALYILARMIGG